MSKTLVPSVNDRPRSKESRQIDPKDTIVDGSSRNGASLALGNMTVPQLTAAAKMLDDCQERYDKLSGICGTMRGLVLAEVKHKLEHGKFLPWLAENFDKSRKTAAQDIRLATEFCKSNPRVTFEILGRDLAETVKELEQAQIDLKHPLVREVAAWVDGRTRYQLLLDFPGQRGGDTSGSHKKLSPEEEHKLFLANAKAQFESVFLSLDKLVEDDTFKAPSITDTLLSDSADLAAEFAKRARAWLKVPRKQRTHPEAEK